MPCCPTSHTGWCCRGGPVTSGPFSLTKQSRRAMPSIDRLGGACPSKCRHVPHEIMDFSRMATTKASICSAGLQPARVGCFHAVSPNVDLFPGYSTRSAGQSVAGHGRKPRAEPHTLIEVIGVLEPTSLRSAETGVESRSRAGRRPLSGDHGPGQARPRRLLPPLACLNQAKMAAIRCLRPSPTARRPPLEHLRARGRGGA